MANMIVSVLIQLACIHWIAPSPLNDSPDMMNIALSQLNSTDRVTVIPKRLNRTTLPSNKSAPATNAKDFLQDLHDKIIGMEKRITKTEDAERTLEGIVSQDSNIFYFPKGTKKHVARKYYQEYDYTFMGWGYRSGGDSQAGVRDANTIRSCLAVCFGKRVSDKTYNGIYFYHAGNVGNRCFCTKNEKGHTKNNDFLHYKYVPVN